MSQQNIVYAIIGVCASLFGTGFGAKIMYVLMKDKMGETFATREALTHLSMSVKEEQERQWEHIVERVIRPLDEMTRTMQGLTIAQTEIATELRMMRERR